MPLSHFTAGDKAGTGRSNAVRFSCESRGLLCQGNPISQA
jgi:hypothetical protein